MNNPLLVIAVAVLNNAENPVVLPRTNSAGWNAVPSVKKPEIVFPTTLVTVNLEEDAVPVS